MVPQAPPGGTRASRHQGPRKMKSVKHGGPGPGPGAQPPAAAPSSRSLAQQIRETVVLAYLTRNERTGPKSPIFCPALHYLP